jgi:hypothetical protein
MSAECLRHRLWPPTLTFNKIRLSESVANRTLGRPGLADDSYRAGRSINPCKKKQALNSPPRKPCLPRRIHSSPGESERRAAPPRKTLTDPTTQSSRRKQAILRTDLTTIQDDPESDAAGSQVADPRETEWWRPFELNHDGPQSSLAAPRIDARAFVRTAPK